MVSGTNRIKEIENHGQSIWFDYIQRGMIWDGTLYRMVENDHLKGVTSNPAIFEKAISKSTDYRPALAALARSGANPIELFESLAIEDIRMACDVLRRVYDQTNARDGFVSLEVSPHLAYDTISTIEEGLRLWNEVGRDNLMIKVPATKEGLPAIEELIAEGVNVNITLLFAVERYQEVHERYLKGLERRHERGFDVSRIASVASFFVSRIDSMIDKIVAERSSGNLPADVKKKMESISGKVAIANAKLAYRSYQRMIEQPRWTKIAKAGARTQRLLWASTSTKNPQYRDVVYLEELIGADTVNTVPEATYAAYQKHGETKPRLTEGIDDAEQTMKRLAECDISMQQVTDKLIEEGVVLFADAFDRLMSAVEAERAKVLGTQLSRMTEFLGAYEERVNARLEEMQKIGFVRRMWDRDPTLWVQDEKQFDAVSGFMGWLDATDQMLASSEHLLELQEDLSDAGATHVFLMGMGGSSLAPDVFRRTFGVQPESPELVVLDSTVPEEIKTAAAAIDPDSTIFVVASKSGSTIEPNAFNEYFWKLSAGTGEQFIAITDPETSLEALALEREFLAVFSGDPEIGGRYSALSPFGLVPAAAMGLDPFDLLERARTMVGSCEASVPPAQNAGARLGAILGELSRAGRDKLTIVTSPRLASLGAWLEQLIAESTGKNGKGIVPVDGEELGAVNEYGNDRVFAFFSVEGDSTAELDQRLTALEKAGHPVLRFQLGDARDLVQEMFRWEVATATAGHVLALNPFDQPNVQESKDLTKSYLLEHEKLGRAPEIEGEVKLGADKNLTLFTDRRNESTFAGKKQLGPMIEAFLNTVVAGDYVALNAYVPMTAENEGLLHRIREKIRARKKVATTVGFGPRFLHSTGQLHKGGPNTGVFFQITCEDREDIPVPNMGFTFGMLKAAQQAGDFIALSKRERRLLRIELGKDVQAGLQAILAALG